MLRPLGPASSLLRSAVPTGRPAPCTNPCVRASPLEQLAVGHHPTYSNGEHGNNTDLVQHLEPLLWRYGVAAYFVGEATSRLVNLREGWLADLNLSEGWLADLNLSEGGLPLWTL